MPPETGLEMARATAPRLRCSPIVSDRPRSARTPTSKAVADANRPEWQPLINPVANLVYSATGDSVRDVLSSPASIWSLVAG